MDKLYCGDCLDVMKEIPEGSVNMILTDPPYRVISGGERTKLPGWRFKNDGKLFKHNDLKEALWFPEIYRVLKEGSHCYIMTNTLNLERFLKLSRKSGFLLHNLLVWEKNNCLPNRWYMKNCEYTLFLRKGKAKKIHNNGSKTVHKFNNPTDKLHPCEKPVGLMQMFIENSSEVGDIVLDFAMGSGTTGVACVNTNRKFIGVELDEGYFNIAKDRINEAELNMILGGE